MIVGFTVTDSSVACMRFFAEGASGEVALSAGVRQDAEREPGQPRRSAARTGRHHRYHRPELAPAGSVYLTLNRPSPTCPAGSAPASATTADSCGRTSGDVHLDTTAEIENARPLNDTITLSKTGLPFDCAAWTNPLGPGELINPVLGFRSDRPRGGDVANLLVLYGEGTTP